MEPWGIFSWTLRWWEENSNLSPSINELMEERDSWTLISSFDTALLSDFSKFESHTRDRLTGLEKTT